MLPSHDLRHLARRRGVAAALGADDAADDGHAGDHDRSHHRDQCRPRAHHLRLWDIAPDLVCIARGKRGAEVRPNFRPARMGTG